MKRILIAEDRAGSRELLRTVLEDCGYEVSEAADGLEAVGKAGRSTDVTTMPNIKWQKTLAGRAADERAAAVVLQGGVDAFG